jgi:clan AA aspartic protease
MTGEVDNSGRDLVALRVRPSPSAEAIPVVVWVDTAFTGELVIPRETIEQLRLQQSAAVTAGLADGTHVVLDTYTCVVEWFGQDRYVEAIENEGRFPLLGVGLLRERRLTIDYRSRTLSIE